MIFIVDTRNQKDGFVVEALERLGHKVIRSKLPYGDIALSTDVFNVIDLKSSGGGLIELAKNRCSKDHNRMKREIEACFDCDGEITFMCFEPNIKSVDDITNWVVPTFKGNLYKNGKIVHRKGEPLTKVSPITLMKTIKTMCTPNHYAIGKKVNFVFATEEDCGEKIVKILTGEKL